MTGIEYTDRGDRLEGPLPPQIGKNSAVEMHSPCLPFGSRDRPGRGRGGGGENGNSTTKMTFCLAVINFPKRLPSERDELLIITGGLSQGLPQESKLN